MRLLSYVIAAALAVAAPVVSGPAGAQVVVPPTPARPADVASIDSIIRAFYDVISGPAGQARQWSRDRSLYIADVRFAATRFRPDGTPVTNLMTHQQFVDGSDAGMVRDGFFETEIHRVTRRIGNIAHVFSTYEMRRRPGSPVFGRGVNSLQLYWDGTRWWIASVVWTDEDAAHPIPADYLPR